MLPRRKVKSTASLHLLLQLGPPKFVIPRLKAKTPATAFLVAVMVSSKKFIFELSINKTMSSHLSAYSSHQYTGSDLN